MASALRPSNTVNAKQLSQPLDQRCTLSVKSLNEAAKAIEKHEISTSTSFVTFKKDKGFGVAGKLNIHFERNRRSNALLKRYIPTYVTKFDIFR